MNKEKIAILIDSGADLPAEILEKEYTFLLPLKILFKNQQYLDRIEITSEEVLEKLATEVPKTSLPDGQCIYDTLEKIQNLGYEKVMVITISSGLSGTFNAIRLATEDFPKLTFALMDTKNIGVAAGFQGIYASELIEQGLDFTTIVEKITASIPKTKVFFSVATLEYLQKGGRIGLVSAILGNVLSLKPIISCNEAGVYYTVSKARGLKKSHEKLKQLILESIPEKGEFALAVAHAGAKEEAETLFAWVKTEFPKVAAYFAPISPALSIHTGPGLLGIAIQVR